MDKDNELTPEQVAKQLGEVEKKLTETEVKVAKSEVITKLAPADYALFYEMDEVQKNAFLDADEAGRTDLLEKSRKRVMLDDDGDDDEDEEGREEMKKRFDDMSLKLELLSKNLKTAETRAEAAETFAKSERDARESVEFTKRAETELTHLPGTAAEKGEILKVLHTKLAKDEFESVHKLLTSGNVAHGQLLTPVGRSTPVSKVAAGTSWETIEKKAEVIAKEEKITHAAAVTKVIQDNPELYTQYLGEQGQRQ